MTEEERRNYNQMRVDRESRLEKDVLVKRIKTLERQNKELRRRLFVMTQAKMALTPMTRL